MPHNSVNRQQTSRWQPITAELDLQGYFIQTLKILQAICKACSRILLPDATRGMYLRSITGRRKERGSSKGLIKAILVDCKRLKRCPYCDAPNGTVKKIAGTFKLLHDPYNKQVRRLHLHWAILSCCT